MFTELMMAATLTTAFTAEELKEANFDAACRARMRSWTAYRAAYRPDYSDSAWALEPPPDNRLDAPFAVVKDGKPASCWIGPLPRIESFVRRPRSFSRTSS